jgi:myo-inositol catabolism protein IolC
LITRLLNALLREQRLRMALRRLLAPDNPDGARIVAALAEFCHARRTSLMVSQQGTIDPLAVAVAEGRREVLLWMMSKASMSDEQLDRAIQREYGNATD